MRKNLAAPHSLWTLLLTFLLPALVLAQPPGLTVINGVGVQDLNGGIARIGDPGGFHIAIDGDDIQAKTSNSASNGRLDINFYGGDIRMGGPGNFFYLKRDQGLGLGTDNPAGPLHIGFGNAGHMFAGTPGGNGPGWIHMTADGDRWDAFAWNNGYQIRKNGTSTVFQFSDNGYMGIGTITPDGPVDIDFGSTGSLVASTPGGNGPGWVHHASNGNRWDIFASIDGFNIDLVGSNTNMYLTNSGRLGIKLGSAGAASDLHVKQTSGNNFSTNGLRLEYGDNTNSWTTLIDSGNDYLLAYNGTWRVWFSETDGAYNQSSDRRVKQGIRAMPNVLERVNKLRPVTYKYKAHADAPRESWGFIAQDVEPLFPDFVSEKKGIKGLAYDNFAVVSIKAIQELSQIIDQQDREIETLKSDLEEIRTKMDQFLARNTGTPSVNQYSLTMDQRALLAQNRPNPFREKTVIEFFVPDDVQSAYLRITDAQGQVLHQVSLDKRGQSQLTIAANTYPAGTYYYALILDGAVIATKKMVLTK